MSRLNASPTKGSPTKGSPSPTKSGASVPTVGNGTNLVNCVSNAAFTKLAERSRAGSASSTRPGTPASPRPSSPVKALTGGKTPVVTLGVCAMDVKARSKAMREILTRLVDIEKGGVDVQIFGDVVILEEGEFVLAPQVAVSWSLAAMKPWWRSSGTDRCRLACCCDSVNTVAGFLVTDIQTLSPS